MVFSMGAHQRAYKLGSAWTTKTRGIFLSTYRGEEKPVALLAATQEWKNKWATVGSGREASEGKKNPRAHHTVALFCTCVHEETGSRN